MGRERSAASQFKPRNETDTNRLLPVHPSFLLIALEEKAKMNQFCVAVVVCLLILVAAVRSSPVPASASVIKFFKACFHI